jgi:hypothetical protein
MLTQKLDDTINNLIAIHVYSPSHVETAWRSSRLITGQNAAQQGEGPKHGLLLRSSCSLVNGNKINLTLGKLPRLEADAAEKLDPSDNQPSTSKHDIQRSERHFPPQLRDLGLDEVEIVSDLISFFADPRLAVA